MIDLHAQHSRRFVDNEQVGVLVDDLEGVADGFHVVGVVFVELRCLMTRQGLPTATVLGGMDLTTTLPAPMVLPCPMVTPGRMVVAPPIQTLSPIMTGRENVRQIAWPFPGGMVRSATCVECVAV